MKRRNSAGANQQPAGHYTPIAARLIVGNANMQNWGFEPIETSYWNQTAELMPPFGSLKESLTADVVVIGGGYTGLSAAIHAAQAGKSVVLVESQQPGWAASGRNGAQVCPMVQVSPAKVIKSLGQDKGGKLLRLIANSGKQVFNLIERHEIDCSPRHHGGVFVARKQKTLQKSINLAKEFAAFGAETRILGREELPVFVRSDRYVGGVEYLDAGLVQPLAFARGLAKAAVKLGVSIYGDSPAIKVDMDGDFHRVITADGDVRAKTVLVGTGGYLQDGIFPELEGTAYTIIAAALATHPLSDKGSSILPLGGPVIDLDDPAVFSPIIDEYGRLVITVLLAGDTPSLKSLSAAADRRLRRAFPQLPPIEWDNFWLGRMTSTPDMLPKIARVRPGIYAMVGCQGLGITYCIAAGAEMAKLTMGVPEKDVCVPVAPPKRVPMADLMPTILRKAVFPLVNRFGA
jgi:glycine/D-amino acid oxidase-like deaminating enzyme